MTRTITIEIPDHIEIKGATDFVTWAGRFGVEVGERGRKPKGKLARAIRDYKGDDWPTKIVDTDYFSAAMADGEVETTEYGVKLAALRTVKDAAVKAANDAFETARTALRKEYGIADKGAVVTGDVVKVTAFTPMLTKEGKVRRTPTVGDKPGRVKFRVDSSTVEVTREHVSKARAIMGKRQGRPSQSDTLAGAVVAGEWFDVELMRTDGWQTVLLKDAVVEPVVATPVTVPEPATADN